MSNRIENLDEMLECAIREKGAIEYMERLDRRKMIRRRKSILYWSCSAAAAIAVLIGLNLKLGYDARSAGYSFDPAFGQMGGSEITALMQEKRISEAEARIKQARLRLAEETAFPSSSDPDYLLQLSTDSQELDLLDAVCLLRKGRYFKAKKALKAIVEAGGAFAEEAGQLLERL